MKKLLHAAAAACLLAGCSPVAQPISASTMWQQAQQHPAATAPTAPPVTSSQPPITTDREAAAWHAGLPTSTSNAELCRVGYRQYCAAATDGLPHATHTQAPELAPAPAPVGTAIYSRCPQSGELAHLCQPLWRTAEADNGMTTAIDVQATHRYQQYGESVAETVIYGPYVPDAPLEGYEAGERLSRVLFLCNRSEMMITVNGAGMRGSVEIPPRSVLAEIKRIACTGPVATPSPEFAPGPIT